MTLTNGQVVSGINFGSKQDIIPTTNRPPVFVSAAPTSGTMSQDYRYDAGASDPDGDALTYDLVVKPAGMVVVGASGVVVWTPAANQVGTHAVTLRVQDGRGGIALQSFQIVVSDGNHTPFITSRPTGA